MLEDRDGDAKRHYWCMRRKTRLEAGNDSLHARATACGRLCRIGNLKRRRRMTTGTVAFPVLRWVGLVWMVVWLPAYMRVWGWANLLHLCDVAVILGCAGLWWGSSLLVSSQAVSSLAAGILWGLDVGSRLLTGRFLVGGTEYMWDARASIFVRLLSSFHLGLPVVLLWAMRKIGYDRRALAFLAVFALGVQYELCVPRSSLSSLLGTCSRAPRRDFCWSGRASLLANPSSLELDVSCGRRCEMK